MVTYHVPEPEVLEYVAENLPLEIIYQDEDVAVVNKHQVMVVHPSAGHISGTLVKCSMYHIRTCRVSMGFCVQNCSPY